MGFNFWPPILIGSVAGAVPAGVLGALPTLTPGATVGAFTGSGTACVDPSGLTATCIFCGGLPPPPGGGGGSLSSSGAPGLAPSCPAICPNVPAPGAVAAGCG